MTEQTDCKPIDRLQRSLYLIAELMSCRWSVTADELHDRIR